MPLHSTLVPPERIFAFGPAGSGKTTNWLNIAKFSHLTRSTARFHVIDTDFAVDRMLIGYPELDVHIPSDPNVHNPSARIHLYPCYDWPEYTTALSTIQRNAVPGDWVVVDFIGNAWAAVQEEYINQVFHQDIADYFLQARKSLAKGSSSLSALDGWVDWQVINRMYRQWINPLLFKGRYHVYATAKSDNLSSDKKPTEDQQTRQMFLRYGIKPVGQKELPFQFHTVLITGRNGEARTITTAGKDRERTELEGQVVKSFTTDYLVKVAGWSLT